MAGALELPIGFAHRGGAVLRHQQNTLAAFGSALQRGATGIESDVALTADGHPVLVHPRLLPRRAAVHRTHRHALPEHVPTVAEVYESAPHHFHLSLDMTAPGAADAVVRIAREHDAADRLWLTYWRIETLRRWHERYPDVRLVFPQLLIRSPSRLRALRDAGVDAVNIHHRFCSRRAVAAAHAHGLLLFAWGARRGAAARRVVNAGADGVYCDDVDGMVTAIRDHRAAGRGSPAPGG